jgi:hypothetical protein
MSFVTPQLRHSGAAIPTCRKRKHVKGQASQHDPGGELAPHPVNTHQEWFGSTRCRLQPDLV